MFTQNLGIDVAYKDLQVCLKVRQSDGKIKIKGSRKFKNTPSGFGALYKWALKKGNEGENMRVTMEATGVYYESLAYYLNEKGWDVFVLLPNRIKGYLKFLNIKSKTDKIEAKGLAELGMNQALPKWEASSPVMYSLKKLHRERTTLLEDKTMISNRLHSQKASYQAEKRTVKRLKAQIRLLDKQIKEIEQEIRAKIKEDEELEQRINKVCELKGVKWLTVSAIVAETNGFKLIERKSQLVSYAGYDVVERQSGSSVNGKTRISKKGNSHIRRALHFPAFGVVKYHDEFTNLYNRVYDRTKVKMKAYVAVQRKLLVLIYTLYKNNDVYDPKYLQKQKLRA